MSNYVTYEVKVYDTGTVVWKQGRNVHRLDGPAITYANGSARWFLHGSEMTEHQHRAAAAKMNCTKMCVDKTISIDGVEYSLVPKTV